MRAAARTRASGKRACRGRLRHAAESGGAMMNARPLTPSAVRMARRAQTCGRLALGASCIRGRSRRIASGSDPAACGGRRAAAVRAVRSQFALGAVPRTLRRACVAPRRALNIVLAGEVCRQTDLHSTGHGPASGSRAGHLFLLEPNGAARRSPRRTVSRDAHPMHHEPTAEAVLRPPPDAGHGDRWRHRIKSCALPIRHGAIRIKTARSQRINATYNTPARQVVRSSR